MISSRHHRCAGRVWHLWRNGRTNVFVPDSSRFIIDVIVTSGRTHPLDFVSPQRARGCARTPLRLSSAAHCCAVHLARAAARLPALATLFVAYTVVTLAFFTYQTTQWFHFAHTVPLLVIVGTELSFCDACA